MSHQFKPGDLALIVAARKYTENIGAVCQLVRLLQPGEKYTAPDGVNCRYTGSNGCGWLVVGDGIVGSRTHRGLAGKVCGHGISDPRHLMPLRGDDEQMRAAAASEREVTL